jgi:arylsulfatase A-like enzyme
MTRRVNAAARNGTAPALPGYAGPKVVLIRFGGGARRQETIADASRSFCPYLLGDLVPRGVLFPKMEIASMEGLATSHGEGTLNLLTGKYDRYVDVDGAPLRARFEAKVPTLFEHLRAAYDVPPHETLIVNCEDRLDEEFYTFSSHPGFGWDYRAKVLSLHRFKIHRLRRQLAEGTLTGRDRTAAEKELAKRTGLDYRERGRADAPDPALDAFWDAWRGHYGDSGLKNPRGDRLLTELTRWSLTHLRPRLVIVNYTDCDFVHWGNASHYTRALQIMDDGVRQIVEAVEADPFYRDDTVFAVVPDCGRDDNPFMPVPYQHHFNSRSAHEVFALFFGAGVARGVRVDRVVQQADVAPTLASVMGLSMPHAEGAALPEVFS